MKISYDRGFNAIGVAVTFFYLSLGLSVLGVFLTKILREYVSATIASIMAKFEQVL